MFFLDFGCLVCFFLFALFFFLITLYSLYCWINNDGGASQHPVPRHFSFVSQSLFVAYTSQVRKVPGPVELEPQARLPTAFGKTHRYVQTKQQLCKHKTIVYYHV